MAGCEIFCLMNASGSEILTDDEGVDKAPVQVNEGAVIHTNDQNKNVASADIKKEQANESTKGVANGHFDDCGAGRHTFSKLIVDSEHVYDVCTCCGYTLVVVQDQRGSSVKQTKNTLVEAEDGRYVVATDENGTPIEDATPVLTYQTDSPVMASSVAGGQNYDIAKDDDGKEIVLSEEIEVEKIGSDNQACEHNFVGVVALEATCQHKGTEIFTCSKCKASYSVTLAQKDHVFYDYVDADKDYRLLEKCKYCEESRSTSICKIGETTYTTLAEAISKAATDGSVTKIVMLNDHAIEGNAGWEIAAKKNIIIDLNGFQLRNLVSESTTSQVFNIKSGASLTIMDSSDTKKNGGGRGMVYNDAGATMAGDWWSDDGNFATNVINNAGTFTLQSGLIYQTAGGSISYAVDTNNTFNMNGGYAYNGGSPTGVRMVCNNTSKNTVNIAGGYIYGSTAGIWIQLPSSSGTPTAELNITGGEVDGGTYGFYDYSYGQAFDNIHYNISGGAVWSYYYPFYTYGANINISGGLLQSYYYAYGYYAYCNAGTINVSGGEFYGFVYSANCSEKVPSFQ